MADSFLVGMSAVNVREGNQNASLRYSGVDWKICRSLHIEFYLGVTICEVGFKQEVVGCGKRGFEFVKEAVISYSIECLLNAKKGSRAQFLLF
jgi:hypothetical protein